MQAQSSEIVVRDADKETRFVVYTFSGEITRRDAVMMYIDATGAYKHSHLLFEMLHVSMRDEALSTMLVDWAQVFIRQGCALAICGLEPKDAEQFINRPILTFDSIEEAIEKITQ